MPGTTVGATSCRHQRRIDYLSKLYLDFGDWQLALAATTVAKAVWHAPFKKKCSKVCPPITPA